jgi:hypothetical protein
LGILDAPGKPFNTAAPNLATPAITDSPIAVVGMSRDRKTLIGASTTAPYQLHYSTNDGTTWSAGLLNSAETAQIIGAVETDNMELLIVPAQSWFLARTSGWTDRTMAGGTITSTHLMSTRASGIYARPQWGLVNHGEISLLAEYGAKSNSPLGNNARYVYMSKDDTRFVPIFDIQANAGALEGLEINPVSGGYHCHAVEYDPWANRIWVTGGDNNDWIVYSDDAADLDIWSDAATTSGSTTLTVASTTTTTFTSRSVGKPIRGAGIPAGTTIASVTDYRTAVLSAAATATASNVLINVGPITWVVYHYGRSGRFQVTGIVPAPEGVYFGADGYPTGFHFAQRNQSGGNKPGRIKNKFMTAAYSTGVGQHLQMGAFRAKDIADPPILITGVSNTTGVGGYLALIHPNGHGVWKLWDDPWTTNAFESIVQVFHTYNGNIVGSIQSARTASGWQMFKVPMPKLPVRSQL